MKTTLLVCLILSVFILSSWALAERTDTREERWDRAADRAESGVAGIGEVAGPGETYVLIIAGGEDNHIVGTAANEHIRSGFGRDQVYGQGGNDILEGGPDNDVLNGGEDNDHVRGQTGDDQLFGGSGNDLLVGGPGADILMGDMGDDVVFGGVGQDEGHYLVDANVLSTDYYDGGPGTDVFKFRVPPEFDSGQAGEIDAMFDVSGGYFDFGMWGIGLVIVNFEDLVVVWEPGVKGKDDDQPLRAEETTWGALKALYR